MSELLAVLTAIWATLFFMGFFDKEKKDKKK